MTMLERLILFSTFGVMAASLYVFAHWLTRGKH